MPATQWPAASVLQVDTHSTCIGHAKTQGRRCRNPIAYANQQEAESVLSDLSRLDPQSPRLECELGELASRLLCRRWHQDQAGVIKRQWQRRIENYVAAETVRRAERVRIERREPVVVRGGAARGPRVEDRRERVTASVVVQSSFSITISIAVGEESGGSRDSGPDGDEPGQQAGHNADSSSPREDPFQQTTVHQSNNSSSSSPTNEPTTRTSAVPPQEHHSTARAEEEQIAASAAAAAETAEPLQPVPEPSTQAQRQSQQSPRHQDSHHTHRNRRAIEGECSICCEDLSDGETTWCRAQCGQNFHADCMSLWHAALEANERAKTCPHW